MKAILLVFSFIIGAAMGSFVCCQARRMRLEEKGKKKLGNRSVCLHCGYQLSVLDNIPIFSWLFLRGKCRKCGKKIGITEFLAEVFMAIAFLLIGLAAGDISQFSGLDWANLIITFIFVTGLGFLAIYDGLYGELPQAVLTFSVICATILLILKQWRLFLSAQNFSFLVPSLLSALGGVAILAGVYFLLYFLSKERLVGGGDWILGLAIALALGDWWLALLVMFFSNVLATFVMLPMVKFNRKAKIYFGPWMVLGYLIVLVGMEAFVNIL